MGGSSCSAEVIHRKPTDRNHGPIEGDQGEHHLQHLMRMLGMIGTPATDGASQFAAFARAKSVQPPSISMTGGAALHLHHQQPGAFDEHEIQLAPTTAPVAIQ